MVHGQHNKLGRAANPEGTQCEHCNNLYFGEIGDQFKLLLKVQFGLALFQPKFAQYGIK